MLWLVHQPAQSDLYSTLDALLIVGGVVLFIAIVYVAVLLWQMYRDK